MYYKINSGVNKEKNICIKVATIIDIPKILSLNDKWTIDSLEFMDKENGFLFCQRYDYKDLKKIINAREATVAYSGDKVIGYFINDNYSKLLKKNQQAIEQSKQLGLIPLNAKVSQRTQIVVEKEFHRQGIPKMMLNFIRPLLVSKYDILFSIGRNDNPKKAAHQGAGWEIIYENDTNYYCIFKLTNHNSKATSPLAKRTLNHK